MKSPLPPGEGWVRAYASCARNTLTPTLSLRERECGFTLLEVLVVMAIIAVLAGVAGFSLSGDMARQVRTQAGQLQQALQMAADEAVYQGAETGAYFSAQGYGFLKYDDAKAQWVAFEEKALRYHALPEDVRLSLSFNGQAYPLPSVINTDKPVVLFSSTGEMTAFSATLYGHGVSVTLQADGFNPVREAP